MSIQGIATSDFQGLNQLKILAQTDERKALPEVTKQFEAIFLQSMLKSMRMGQHFLDESSPFNGKNQATFQEMLDAQYASTIASGSKGIGLANSLAQSLQKTAPIPASARSYLPPAPVVAKAAVEKPASAMAGVEDFVKSIWPMAKQAAAVIGLDPKLLIAQAALETGWGKFVAKDATGLSSNNLFNIKSGQHSEYDAVEVKTKEYIADTPISVSASFRKYPSVEQSFHDYVHLITSSDRYQTALANANNPEQYVSELNKAGYATDPHYAEKILSIYHGDELQNALQRCAD